MTYRTLITIANNVPDQPKKMEARVQFARLGQVIQRELGPYQEVLKQILAEHGQNTAEWPNEAEQELEELLDTSVDAELPEIDLDVLSDADEIGVPLLQLLNEAGVITFE